MYEDGFCTALLRVPCNDAIKAVIAEHLRLVKEGVIDYRVEQKRELFPFLGARFLFDRRNKSLPLSWNNHVPV